MGSPPIPTIHHAGGTLPRLSPAVKGCGDQIRERAWAYPRPMRTRRSAASRLRLQELLERLSRRAVVDGVVLFGSGATGRLGTASDYDLWLVIGEPSPPLLLALTHVEGRLADVLFTKAAHVDALLRGERPAAGWPPEGFVLAAKTGRIVLDRSGRLSALAALPDRHARPDEDEREREWFRAWYDVHQTRRMLASDDPVYATAVDVRLLYTLHQVWTRYFLVRGLNVAGEKEAIRWLERSDPAFLERFRACLAENDRARKVSLYAELVALALAPVGGEWSEGHTAVQMLEGASDQVEQGLAFWDDLVGGPPSG